MKHTPTDEDERDIKIARERLREIDAHPESVIRGEKVIALFAETDALGRLRGSWAWPLRNRCLLVGRSASWWRVRSVRWHTGVGLALGPVVFLIVKATHSPQEQKGQPDE